MYASLLHKLTFGRVFENSCQLWRLEFCQLFLCPSVLSQLGLNSEEFWDLVLGLLSAGLVSER